MANSNKKSDQDKRQEYKLEIFRSKVKWYCRFVGKTQQALADRLGYRESIFSSKLHHSNSSILTYRDVREIIKVLAEWQALNSKREALELLRLVNLGNQTFSAIEWSSFPLSRLDMEVEETFFNREELAKKSGQFGANVF